MSESKVFMFPESGASNGEIVSLLAPLLQQRGLDPNLLLMNNRNSSGFGGEGAWFMWIIFLFFIMGWGGNGFGRFGNNQGVLAGDAYLGNLINNDTGRELLMLAIQGNGSAIGQLATTLNCDINSVKSAINGVMSQVQGVGNQVGMSAQLIINAIQSGNAQIASQLAQCCCDNQLAICQQTNTLLNAINNVATGQERGFSAIAYETLRLTCDIQNSIKDATQSILEGQRAAELREMQGKIDALRELNSQKDVIINNGLQTAIFSQMIQQATTPIANAVANLQGDVNGIKCKLPETATIPYSPVVGIPASVVALANLYGLANAGFYNTCGCNSLWG